MVMTKRGIFHNLNESEYAISNGEIAFFFSSTFYLGKFLEEYKDHRLVFRDKIARTMIVDEINTDLIADIRLYKEIEKRGFRSTFLKNIEDNVGLVDIIAEKGDINWQELNQFALAKTTEKNTLDWSEMPVQK